MEFLDLFEISEIDELIDRPERRYSLSMQSVTDDTNFGLCNIFVALSPHLSEDEDQKCILPKSSEKKSPILYLHKNHLNVSMKIGTLTYEQRQIKLKRYREKKKNRVWSKKINYNCRKKVAENRLRIRGRFVKKEQALVLQKISESCEINISN